MEIDRVAQLAERYGDRFGARVYSPGEWALYRTRPASLAARFAAKEATIKALRCNAVALHEIEVTRNADGAPSLQLAGRARARAEELRVKHISVSLSHARDHAVAVVVLERENADGG